MILYLDSQADKRAISPPWLDGAEMLQRREAKAGRLWGCGDPYLMDIHPTADWHTLDDGWKCAQIDGPDSGRLHRDQKWTPTTTVADLRGNLWLVPQILNANGERQIRMTYGDDWLPRPTDLQVRCTAIAIAAREALKAQSLGGDGVPMANACQWAAELLCAVNHVSISVIQKESLLDDALVGGILMQATGLAPQ